jgi:hypothetical protein
VAGVDIGGRRIGFPFAGSVCWPSCPRHLNGSSPSSIVYHHQRKHSCGAHARLDRYHGLLECVWAFAPCFLSAVVLGCPATRVSAPSWHDALLRGNNVPIDRRPLMAQVDQKLDRHGGFLIGLRCSITGLASDVCR